MHLFGFDSSYREDDSHADDHVFDYREQSMGDGPGEHHRENSHIAIRVYCNRGIT